MKKYLAALLISFAATCACSPPELDNEHRSEQRHNPKAEPSIILTEDTEPAVAPKNGGEVTVGLSDDGTGFDTTQPIMPGSMHVIMPMIDTLVSVTEDGHWAPNVAESFISSHDHSVWEIKLREGIKFHDGADLDAAALIANIKAFRKSILVGYAFSGIEEIETVDELTVKITLDGPWATFPHQFTGPPGFLVSPDTIGTNDSFVGIGPYMFESWQPGVSARVIANPNYWKPQKPHLDAINFKFFPDPSAKRQAFDAGEIDAIINPHQSDITDFFDSDKANIAISGGEVNEYLFLLNTTTEPFNDIGMRRAFSHALDRELIVQKFHAGLTEPAYGPFHKSSVWHTKTDYPGYEPEKAKALVAEYISRGGDPTFSITLEPNPEVVEVVEAVIGFLEEAGMNVELRMIPIGDSAITALADDFQAISWMQFGSPDPDWMLPFFHSQGGLLNWTNLANPTIDEAFENGRLTDDFAIRFDAYAAFQHELAKEVPIIWIDHQNGVEAVISKPWLKGLGQFHYLPGGEKELPMQNGTYFNWTHIWLDE